VSRERPKGVDNEAMAKCVEIDNLSIPNQGGGLGTSGLFATTQYHVKTTSNAKRAKVAKKISWI
jgi:hypothetical protein